MCFSQGFCARNASNHEGVMNFPPAWWPPLLHKAWAGDPWLRALLWPLTISLTVHALIAAVYFAFISGRTSPVTTWLRELDPSAMQPPRLSMTLVVMAGEDNADAASAPASSPQVIVTPESDEPAPQTPALPPPTTEVPAAARVTPADNPAPVSITPPPPPPALAEPVIPQSTLVPAVPLPAAAAPTMTAPGLPSPTAATASPVPSARSVALSGGLAVQPSGAGGGGELQQATAGGYAAPRLRHPADLKKFYPYSARSHSITGVTHLELQLDERGRVAQIRLVASEPAGVFEQAARNVARSLRFEPARRNGKPTSADFHLTLEWRLEP